MIDNVPKEISFNSINRIKCFWTFSLTVGILFKKIVPSLGIFLTREDNFLTLHCNTWIKKQHPLITSLRYSLHEECPNKEFFLVRIQENKAKKKSRIWALFTQWFSTSIYFRDIESSLNVMYNWKKWSIICKQPKQSGI